MPAPAPCSRRCSPSSCGGIFWSDTYSTTYGGSGHDGAAFLSCFCDRVCGRVLGRVRDLGLEKLRPVHLPSCDQRVRLGRRKTEGRRSCDVLVRLAGDVDHRRFGGGTHRLLASPAPDGTTVVRLVVGRAGVRDSGVLLHAQELLSALM